MFLHNNEALFRDVLEAASTKLNRPLAIVEKDYYVTMILKLLVEQTPSCVFKGGTSLSKCYKVIDRFSEDIDISFPKELTEGERRRLKNETIAGISRELDLPIVDWDMARSRRDYNCYTFQYKSVLDAIPTSLISGVKMEVSLSVPSFPTRRLPVDSYAYEFLKKDNIDIIEQYHLQPFEMNLQSLERTFIDKVFALCDYYLSEKIQRNSRHIYDLFMLKPQISFDEGFKRLIKEVRNERAKSIICLSAKKGVRLEEILDTIIRKEIYRSDYEEITTYFQNRPVSYQEATQVLNYIIDSEIFNGDNSYLVESNCEKKGKSDLSIEKLYKL